ncbi:MAG TPA: FAD-binding oxidoreductase, partial [Acidimicrobiales bacterium]|nr:FAD-binding oxidoreductase [Acidimicrobiales bacterium]
NANDVARCITFARDHRLPIAARSGGHSYAGYSTTTGLVIDVSLMSRLTMAAGASKTGWIATVGAGARLIDVYSGLEQQGFSIPAGSCPTVGIAGLALGGGIGVMDRLWGLTSDNIVGLEIVTAAGEIVRADAANNADLYWACRGGGGGNFGIVTEFRFSAFPLTATALFFATWPWEAARQLLPAWLEWAPAGPDELWSNCILGADPGAAHPYIRVGGVWAGSEASAQAQLNRLIAMAGPPSSQVVGQNAFEDAMYIEADCGGLSETECHLSGRYPGGTLPRAITVAKSDILNEPLSDAGVEAVLAGIERRQPEGGPGGVVLDSWGGAINRVAPGATAFVHRKALASAQYAAILSEGAHPEAIEGARNWMSNWYATLRPYMSGEAYQNYIDPALPNWEKAYYGANLARLRQVKGKWDPGDVFHFAQSIPLPAAKSEQVRISGTPTSWGSREEREASQLGHDHHRRKQDHRQGVHPGAVHQGKPRRGR